MKPIDIIEQETAKLGYRAEAMRRDYAFSDVWGESNVTCSVPFAAFTQTPPSYRSAAFAVIEAAPDAAAEIIRSYRSLGAPVFLAIEPDQISVWQVYATQLPRKIAEFATDAIPEFFAEQHENWSPNTIHRAKSIGHIEKEAQLDFVDLGLIPAIAGEIHVKLDRLIREAVAGMREFDSEDAMRIFFRGVFRLLAAKILMDRQHHRTQNWNVEDVRSVLNAMDDFYKLGNVSQAWPASAISALEPVWTIFRSGFNVANISADDLAYVYETTLVTDKARAEFGTHSTPRHIADYIVGRLRLWKYEAEPPHVYEPFTGAGVFLGSALRFMRDALPTDWDDERRHDLLVKRISGDEIEPFAVEVAQLSLILADYPNANGWEIGETDLFEAEELRDRLAGADVVLCNPPFEAFKGREVTAYSDAVKVNRSKAVYAFEKALQAEPDMLGFVLPNTVLVDRRYKCQRILLEQTYGEIELVALPDGVFNKSQVNSALVIARKPLSKKKHQQIRSAVVFDRDKKSFMANGTPSLIRELKRPISDTPKGDLWIYPSQDLWDRLGALPKLGSVIKASWGLRWKAGQKGRTSDIPGPNREPGFQDTSSIDQYVLKDPRWMDVHPDQILAGGNLAWDEPKILCNATRLSRGYWRLAAAVDRLGRRATQQFMGLWPLSEMGIDLDALAAVINGPVINAYMTEHSFDKRFRISTLHEAPIPDELPPSLGVLSRDYAETSAMMDADPDILSEMLAEIDALVFDAYGLAPEDREQLLASIGQDDRPVVGSQSRRPRTNKRKSEGPDSHGQLFESSEFQRDQGQGFGTVVSRNVGARLIDAQVEDLPLTAWAGPVVNAATLASQLGISSQKLKRWNTNHDVIALSEDGGRQLYPVEQFENDRPIAGIRSVLSIINQPKVAWQWLRTPRIATDEAAPIELLKMGKIDRALLLAKRDFG